MSSQNSQILTSENIEKQILYWNLSTFNNLAAFTDLLNREINHQTPTQNDFDIRDFYFTNKLTIDGKFQPQSFIQKSVPYLGNFVSIDKNTYLQSINFANNVQKYRFWRNILDMKSSSKQIVQSKSRTSQALWSYRVPVFLFFGSFMFAYIYATGIIKLKKTKQLSLMISSLIAADILIKRRKSSDIFYSIQNLPDQKLEQERKDIINRSILLDGKIYDLSFKRPNSDSLMMQAATETDLQTKKLLIQTAGFDVITEPTFII